MVKSLKQTVREYYKEIFFEASSDFQEWTVPEGVTSIHATVVGAKGKNGKSVGGAGGKVECDLEVTPGDTLYVYAGLMNTTGIATYTASDIRTDNTGITDTTSLNSRIIVAGAGGNGSDGDRNYFYQGGAGGGLTGGAGVAARNAAGGGGGTQSSGGSSYTSSGTTGSYGTFGLGGNGSAASAGGAGWYGGGGGSTNGHDAQYWHSGGGGGSSYTDPNLCSNVVHTQGANADGDGYIKIKYLSTKDDYTEVITKGVEYKGIYRSNVRRYFKDIIFEASDSIQEWTVPSKTKSIHVQVFGGQGGNSYKGNTIGGKGGKVECDLSVIPGQKLYIVAGNKSPNQSIGYTPGKASYNASDIRTDGTGITDITSLRSRLVVAGGGGSGGGTANGGAGGDLTGQRTGTNIGAGYGGTQLAGGAGGPNDIGWGDGVELGKPGTFGLGGYTNDTGGFGGAGYYGGGSGCASWKSNSTYNSGPGGGGSSYTDPTLCTDVVHTQGVNEGNGYVIITLPGTPTDYTRYEDLGPECKLWSNYTGTYKQIEPEKGEGTYTLTVNHTPSDATVVLTGTNGTQSGNSITVKANTLATYEVSKANYETKTNSVYMNADKTINVSLRKYCTLTINPTPSDAIVKFTIDDVEIEDTTITVVEGTEVSYTVSKSGYITQTNTVAVNNTQTINITLAQDGVY